MLSLEGRQSHQGKLCMLALPNRCMYQPSMELCRRCDQIPSLTSPLELVDRIQLLRLRNSPLGSQSKCLVPDWTQTSQLDSSLEQFHHLGIYGQSGTFGSVHLVYLHSSQLHKLVVPTSCRRTLSLLDTVCTSAHQEETDDKQDRGKVSCGMDIDGSRGNRHMQSTLPRSKFHRCMRPAAPT
jgi:hypothetical protein